jgi:hypothetical protein
LFQNAPLAALLLQVNPVTNYRSTSRQHKKRCGLFGIVSRAFQRNSSGNKEMKTTLEVPTSDASQIKRLFAPPAGPKSQPDSFQAAARIKRSGETLEPLRIGISDRSPD